MGETVGGVDAVGDFRGAQGGGAEWLCARCQAPMPANKSKVNRGKLNTSVNSSRKVRGSPSRTGRSLTQNAVAGDDALQQGAVRDNVVPGHV